MQRAYIYEREEEPTQIKATKIEVNRERPVKLNMDGPIACR